MMRKEGHFSSGVLNQTGQLSNTLSQKTNKQTNKNLLKPTQNIKPKSGRDLRADGFSEM
jgi:hypothetical protein